MRFLCASNLHLGRRVSGLPEHAGLDPSQVSARVALNRLASAAASHDVDAVLLAGDVIDREAGQFEPAGMLQEALGALEREDIPVVAIAGDEDFDSLPRAIGMPGGAGVILLDADRPSFDLDGVTVVGVSQAGQAGMPDMTSLIRDVDGDAPMIAMLHASLTDGHAPEGTFQPVQLSELSAFPNSVCVLGAQRESDVVVDEGTTVIETGAILPTGLSETGPHGATLVEIDDEGVVTCDLIPLAPVQFADIDLDLTEMGDLEAIESVLVRALDDTLSDVLAGDAMASLAGVICTVHLTGATPVHAELPVLMEELERTLAMQHRGVVVAIGDIHIDTRPDVDLAPLVGRPDPVGELARLLQALGDEGQLSEAQETLVQRTVDRLLGVHRSRVFAGVAHDPPPETEDARMYLRREAWNVLDALVRQRGVD